jgi:putative acetyltransferase
MRGSPETMSDSESEAPSAQPESAERAKLTVRPENETDVAAIDDLVRAAFRSEVEPKLVKLIRASPNYVPGLSLVAEHAGKVVGHVMLSYVELEDGDQRHRVLTLSPVAVDPASQRKGVGSALITTAIRAADEKGEPVIILEGDPRYYRRFGFKGAGELGIAIDLPHWAAPEAAQAIALSNYDPSISGNVAYPPAFTAAEALP